MIVTLFAVTAAGAFAIAALVVVQLVASRSGEAQHGSLTRARSRRQLEDVVDGSPVLRRAMEVTANLAERRGILGSVERSLRAADIPLRPAEVIFAYGLLAVVVPAITMSVLQSPQLFVLTVVLFVALPPQVLKFAVKARRKKFVRQLPDALTTLAGSLRAGRSLGQALDALAREMPAPMGRELRKIVAEIRLGRPLSNSLDEAVERVDSPDFRWAMLAIQIQAEVGGNLAELLAQVADTMRARSRLRGEVRALTAEGRASAAMLVIMPPALGVVMYAVNPAYMSPMLTQTGGHIMLGVSAVMMLLGFLWMKKIVTIDV